MLHKNLEPGRWFKFSLFEQLANVGCDVDRSIYWRKQNNMDSCRKAFERALELLDLTIDDPKNRKGKLRELLRVREALIDYFIYDNEYQTDDEFWHSYFFSFNYAAALQQGK
jgi:hypothetical protein